MRRLVRFAVVLAFLAVPGALAAESLVVGSKNFAESRLLAEIFAQVIEAHTEIGVERRLGLAGTQVCFAALVSGDIDLYPEYTGTGLASILGREPITDPRRTRAIVRREFARRWNLVWLAPLGFENSYELAVPRPLADRLGVTSLSDLVPHAARLRAGLGYEFVERPDGLPGLAATYGLEFAEVRRMQQTLKYQAVTDGRIDVLDVYTTDGRLVSHDLVVLEDDRAFFPPYEAAPLAHSRLLESFPRAAAVLGLLGGSLDAATMRRLNHRLQEGGESERRVAADALRELGLAGGGDPDEEQPVGHRGLASYLLANRTALLGYTLEHLVLCTLALGAGIGTALPLGLWLERRRGWAERTIRSVGLLQTVPSIALLAFMIPLLGVGTVPAITALWLYSLFPILRNTYSGVRDADPEAVDAATALGMTERQVLVQVRLPLAAPVILAGIRTAAVITVGTATLAAFIGAGGLGEPIVTGLQLADTRMILAGAIPAALLAVLVDLTLATVEAAVRPRGLPGEDAG